MFTIWMNNIISISKTNNFIICLCYKTNSAFIVVKFFDIIHIKNHIIIFYNII